MDVMVTFDIEDGDTTDYEEVYLTLRKLGTSLECSSKSVEDKTKNIYYDESLPESTAIIRNIKYKSIITVESLIETDLKKYGVKFEVIEYHK